VTVGVGVSLIQVSLDAQVRETINRKMVTPSSHTFDEAQIQIYTLMQRDSYPRFLNSQIYKRLLGNHAQQLQPSPSSTASPLDPPPPAAADPQQQPPPAHPPLPQPQQQQQQSESSSS